MGLIVSYQNIYRNKSNSDPNLKFKVLMDSTTSAILSISKALSCCLHSLQMETWVESEVGIFFSKAVPCQDKCDKTKRHMILQIRLLQIIRVSEISDLLQWVVCDNEIKIIFYPPIFYLEIWVLTNQWYSIY